MNADAVPLRDLVLFAYRRALYLWRDRLPRVVGVRMPDPPWRPAVFESAARAAHLIITETSRADVLLQRLDPERAADLWVECQFEAWSPGRPGPYVTALGGPGAVARFRRAISARREHPSEFRAEEPREVSLERFVASTRIALERLPPMLAGEPDPMWVWYRTVPLEALAVGSLAFAIWSTGVDEHRRAALSCALHVLAHDFRLETALRAVVARIAREPATAPTGSAIESDDAERVAWIDRQRRYLQAAVRLAVLQDSKGRT